MGWGLLTAVGVGPTGSLDRNVNLELKLDRDGRPIELSLTASGTIAAGAIGARRASPGRSASAARRGERRQCRARRPPVGARGARRPHRSGRRGGMERGAAQPRESRRRSAALGSDHAHAGAPRRAQLCREHRVRRRRAASVAHGVKLGGELDRTTDSARLLTASTRPPGGVWERRVDCLTRHARDNLRRACEHLFVCPTSSCTATPPTPSWTAPPSPRSCSSRPCATGTPRSRSPTTTRCRARWSSRRGPRRSA